MGIGRTNMGMVIKDQLLIQALMDGTTEYTKDLVMPDTITKINQYAFAYKSNFKGALYLPNNLTTIENYAFEFCSGFTGNLTFPNISSIPTYAFNSCSNIEAIVVPSSVSSIATYAFGNCTKLTSVDLYRTIPTSIQASSFNGIAPKFYVPADNIYAYKTATNWTSFAVRIMGRKDYIIDDTFESFAQGVYTTTTWYPTKEDLVAGTNAIASGSTVTATGTYYCTLT